ncbi:MAG: ceramidase domain-containing protein [Salinibacterium sp.]|nr:ceramidase domain-containing protein [Salinibacterium sp.]
MTDRLSTAARTALAVVLTLGLAALLYFVAQWLGTSDLATRPATCVETGCFCEAPQTVFPAQLADSFSSLAFVFVGLWTVLGGLRPAPGTPERRLTPIFGAIFVFIGASSFTYHATLSFFGQFLDIFSMYTFGILLALGALYRSGRLRSRTAIALFVALAVILAVVQYLVPDARRLLFAALLLPGIVLELMPSVTGHSPRSPKVRFIYVGVATMVVAYGIWLLDQTPYFCEGHSLLQGHAIWHVLGAVAAVMIVVHYRRTQHLD